MKYTEAMCNVSGLICLIILTLSLFSIILCALLVCSCNCLISRTKIKCIHDEIYVYGIIKSAYKCFILRINKIDTENIQTEEELDKMYEDCINKKKDLKMSH